MSIPQTPSPLSNIIASKTYNAAWFTGATKEAQITAAIAAAVTDGALYVYVPANMLPYNSGAVTFNNAITMLREGGLTGGFDVEAYGASASGTAAQNTTAIQAAIFRSLNITDLTQQPTSLSGPVLLGGNYPITTIYLPRYHEIRGRSCKDGFSSTTNAPMIVIGRSLVETSWVEGVLYNVSLTGLTTAGAGQHGIQCGLSGAVAYIANIDWRSVSITNVGGEGVRIVADNVAGAIIRMDWDKVKVVNSQLYCVHIKVGILNVVHTNDSVFSDCGNGYFIEDIGSGTTASESIAFRSTQFESLGQVLGGAMAVGSFGFKSTMYTGHYSFDAGCYFEGNGNAVGDTTGTNIYVRAPWMLSVRNSLLASSNNQIWMAFGGQAIVEGNYIAAGVNMTSIFTFDSPQPGSDYSNMHVGKNKWDIGYSSSQFSRIINGSLTTLTGYSLGTNYAETQSRIVRDVLRDGITKTVDNGAIGYNAVKRLANNAGGSTSIADSGIASICTNVVTSMVLVTEYNNSRFALFLLASGRAPVLVAQDAAGKYTITKDTASSLNVYNDSVTTNTWVVQNKTGSAALLAVRFIGCEPMEHADDGYYETQYA